MRFTTTNHHTWQTLYERQLPNIRRLACKQYLDGFDRLGLPSDKVPSLPWLNSRIHPVSGWTIVRTPTRYLTDVQWANHMRSKKFPITGYIREPKDLEFTPEPDIFHDVLGHLPMFMNPELLDLLNIFSKFYVTATQETLLPVAQLWWNSIEFALISENGSPKAFGAGFMSSSKEINHAFTVSHIPFSLENAIAKPRAVFNLHDSFLIIKSVEALRAELHKFGVK